MFFSSSKAVFSVEVIDFLLIVVSDIHPEDLQLRNDLQQERLVCFFTSIDLFY